MMRCVHSATSLHQRQQFLSSNETAVASEDINNCEDNRPILRFTQAAAIYTLFIYCIVPLLLIGVFYGQTASRLFHREKCLEDSNARQHRKRTKAAGFVLVQCSLLVHCQIRFSMQNIERLHSRRIQSTGPFKCRRRNINVQISPSFIASDLDHTEASRPQHYCVFSRHMFQHSEDSAFDNLTVVYVITVDISNDLGIFV
jgi:hypothetical protein